MIETLPEPDKELLRHSLFVGLARNSFSLQQERSSNPFLVRNLMGVDPRHGAMAVADSLQVGQRLQFQLRDGATSRQELDGLLADAQQAATAADPALLFACQGGAKGSMGSHVDTSLCRKHFPELPVSGLFCNGEIGPVDGSTQLHATPHAGPLWFQPPPEVLAAARQSTQQLLPARAPVPGLSSCLPRLSSRSTSTWLRQRVPAANGKPLPPAQSPGPGDPPPLGEAGGSRAGTTRAHQPALSVLQRQHQPRNWLAQLPIGMLELVTIQYPDPGSKSGTERRMVQPELISWVAGAMAPGLSCFCRAMFPM